MRGYDVTSGRYVVYPLWRHIVTSFVMSHGTCAKAIKQPDGASWGTHWSNSCWEVHVHAWIDALASPHWESLLPSNIADWVVLIRPCASAFIDAPITLWERPGNAVFFLRSTASTGPSCLSVGARVHYLLSCCLHLRKHSAAAATYITSARRMSQILASLGGRQLEWHEWPDPWTVCHLGCDPSHQVWLRENRRTAIRSRTRRVSKSDWDDFADVASCKPNAHPMVLG